METFFSRYGVDLTRYSLTLKLVVEGSSYGYNPGEKGTFVPCVVRICDSLLYGRLYEPLK